MKQLAKIYFKQWLKQYHFSWRKGLYATVITATGAACILTNMYLWWLFLLVYLSSILNVHLFRNALYFTQEDFRLLNLFQEKRWAIFYLLQWILLDDPLLNSVSSAVFLWMLYDLQGGLSALSYCIILLLFYYLGCLLFRYQDRLSDTQKNHKIITEAVMVILIMSGLFVYRNRWSMIITRPELWAVGIYGVYALLLTTWIWMLSSRQVMAPSSRWFQRWVPLMGLINYKEFVINQKALLQNLMNLVLLLLLMAWYPDTPSSILALVIINANVYLFREDNAFKNLLWDHFFLNRNIVRSDRLKYLMRKMGFVVGYSLVIKLLLLLSFHLIATPHALFGYMGGILFVSLTEWNGLFIQRRLIRFQNLTIKGMILVLLIGSIYLSFGRWTIGLIMGALIFQVINLSLNMRRYLNENN